MTERVMTITERINNSEFIETRDGFGSAKGEWSDIGARAEHIACASGSDYGSPRWVKQYNRALAHLREVIKP